MTHHNSLNILLVDDDPIFLSMGSELIYQSTGIQPLLTEDGLSAEQIMRNQPVDILITDTNMPGKNGIDLIRWTRQHRPETQIFSLFNGLIGTELKREDVLSIGAHHVLTKTEITSKLIPELQKRIHQIIEYKKPCI